jgi:outer membrane protein TolC
MKRIFVLTALMISSIAGMSQESPIKDQKLKELVDKAVNNFPKLKEMEERLKLNDVQAEIIQSNYKPTLGADLQYQYLNPLSTVTFGGDKFRFQPYNNFNTGLTLKQLVYDFGKTKLALERNQAEQDLTADNIYNNKNALAYEVASVYYAIRFTNKAIEVQERQIASLKENERLINAKLKNGDALQYDLLTTQVRTANSDNRLKDLKNMLEKNFVLLQWLTGSDERAALGGADLNDELALQTQPGDWKTNNPEAKIINRNIELYNYDLKEAVVNERPTIGTQFSGGWRNGYLPNLTKWQINGAAGLGVTIPIFSASRPKLQQKLTRVNIEVANRSLTTLESDITKDLATVNQDYQTLQQKVGDQKILVEQAEKAYQLAETRFKNGLITNVELLTIQTSVEDANLNLLQLQYLMILDKLESNKVIGTKMF